MNKALPNEHDIKVFSRGFLAGNWFFAKNGSPMKRRGAVLSPGEGGKRMVPIISRYLKSLRWAGEASRIRG